MPTRSHFRDGIQLRRERSELGPEYIPVFPLSSCWFLSLIIVHLEFSFPPPSLCFRARILVFLSTAFKVKFSNTVKYFDSHLSMLCLSPQLFRKFSFTWDYMPNGTRTNFDVFSLFTLDPQKKGGESPKMMMIDWCSCRTMSSHKWLHKAIFIHPL